MAKRRTVPRDFVPRTHVILRGVLSDTPKVRRLGSGEAICDVSVEVGNDTFPITLRGGFAEAAENIESGSGVLIEGTLRCITWKLQRGDGREAMSIEVERIAALERPYREDSVVKDMI